MSDLSLFPPVPCPRLARTGDGAGSPSGLLSPPFPHPRPPPALPVVHPASSLSSAPSVPCGPLLPPVLCHCFHRPTGCHPAPFPAAAAAPGRHISFMPASVRRMPSARWTVPGSACRDAAGGPAATRDGARACIWPGWGPDVHMARRRRRCAAALLLKVPRMLGPTREN